jgi:molybdopterin molybdotransferase
MISVNEALELIREHVHPGVRQTIPLADAVYRRLAESIGSDVDSPPHDKSVMDGFAVRSEDIQAGLRDLKVIETVVAGGWPNKSLETGQATRIMTGAPMPIGADAVVMIESTETRSDDSGDWVRINADQIPSGKHCMKRAGNFSTGDTVFTAGHVVRPTDVGLLAEVGCHSVPTYALPSVAVLPTGDELVGCEHLPERGHIRNSNGPMLVAMAESLRLPTTSLGIGRDDPTQLSQLIERGLDHEILMLSGGVSAGMMDLVPGLLKEQGVKQIFHKVKMKPGKPVWFGIRDSGDRQTLVFGLPGNPVSSLVGFHLFVRAAVDQVSGGTAAAPASVACVLAAPHQTRGNRPTYWPGRQITDSETTRKVQPLPWNGSSDLRALGQADGLIYFSADSHDHTEGEIVTFFPF